MTEYEKIAPLLKIAAKDNFVAFCYFYDYDFFKARPFLKEIAIAMQQIADGELHKLAVSLPPRAGKSYISSLYCAWMLGKYPTESVMRNTCTATLYNKLSYDTRDILKSEKFQAVFPDVKISSDKSNVQGWNTNQSKQVGYFGAGVGGTIIGFGASKVAITDDLFRNMEDAMSETIRDKTHSWKEATHDSRKEKGCAEIDIGTRWVRDDVIGKQSELGYYDKEIIIPALIENDQGELVSFCEAVMSTAEYIQKKERTTPEIWEAEYMQRPVDIKGRTFENLKWFSDIDAIRENSEGSLAYIDVADEGGDYLCALIGNVVNTDVYITDALYNKANTDVTIPECAKMLLDNGVRYARVETNGMGAIFLKELRKEITRQFQARINQIKELDEKGIEHNLKPYIHEPQLIGITNKTNKITRIIMNSSYVLRKFYFLKDQPGEYGLFVRALQDFSKDGKNKNDDAPDATTGLAFMFQSFMPKLDEPDAIQSPDEAA